MNQVELLQFQYYIDNQRYIYSQLWGHVENKEALMQDELLHAYIQSNIDIESKVREQQQQNEQRKVKEIET